MPYALERVRLHQASGPSVGQHFPYSALAHFEDLPANGIGRGRTECRG